MVFHIVNSKSGGVFKVVQGLSDHIENSKVLLVRPFSPLFWYDLFCAVLLTRRGKAIFHIHGCWTFHLLVGFFLKKRFLFSPHGAFHPVSLEKSSLKKRIASILYVKPILRRASVVHALTTAERNHILSYESTLLDIKIIGNFFEKKSFGYDKSLSRVIAKFCHHRRCLVYMGRLHPSKGIEIMLLALSKKKLSEKIALIICGSGDQLYEMQLVEMVNKLGLTDSVKFLGYVDGSAKDTVLDMADCTILPSMHEAFPISILESYSHCVPAIISREVPLDFISEKKFGWICDVNVDSLTSTLEEFNIVNTQICRQMGCFGYEYFDKNYSVRVLIRKFKDVYSNILLCK